jgi:hypothetical protein
MLIFCVCLYGLRFLFTYSAYFIFCLSVCSSVCLSIMFVYFSYPPGVLGTLLLAIMGVWLLLSSGEELLANWKIFLNLILTFIQIIFRTWLFLKRFLKQLILFFILSFCLFLSLSLSIFLFLLSSALFYFNTIYQLSLQYIVPLKNTPILFGNCKTVKCFFFVFWPDRFRFRSCSCEAIRLCDQGSNNGSYWRMQGSQLEPIQGSKSHFVNI